MAKEVAVVRYEFDVLAGRGSSGYQSLTDAAHDAAKTFFGDHEFTLQMNVSGRKDQFSVECVATAEVEVTQ